MKAKWLSWAAIIVAFFLTISEAKSTEYVVTDLGPLVQNQPSGARDINVHGQVVGWAYNGETVPSGGAPVSRPFIWSSENGMQDLGTLPGAVFGSAYAINDLGWVVGTSASKATLWRPGLPPLDINALLGSVGSQAMDINNQGQIIGVAGMGSGDNFAFIWSEADGITDLGSLAGDKASTGPQAINDDGTVVGNSPAASGQVHAFVWKSETGMIDLYPDWPDRSYTAAAINDAGDIAGMAETQNTVSPALWVMGTSEPVVANIDHGWATGINEQGIMVGKDYAAQRPFVWNGQDEPEYLPSLTGVLVSDATRAINAAGWIVGTSINEDGFNTATLWEPIPEPATLSLLAMGGLVLLRRKHLVK